MADVYGFSGSTWRDKPNIMGQLLWSLGAPPDPESFNVSARRRLFATSGAVSVPLSSSNTASAIVTIPDTVNQNDGLFFELLGGQVTPTDTSGHLSIVDCSLSLGNGSNLFLPIATPEPTTLIPRVNTSLLFGAVPLLTNPDMNQWSLLAGAGALNPSNIQVQLSVSMVNNDGAAAHIFTVRLWVGYRFVNGLGGA